MKKRTSWLAGLRGEREAGIFSGKARSRKAINEAENTLYDVLGIPPKTPVRAKERRQIPQGSLPEGRGVEIDRQETASYPSVRDFPEREGLGGETIPFAVVAESRLRARRRRSRKHLSFLATRYATHIVVIILALGVLLGGGFRGLTVQAARYQADYIENGLRIGANTEGIGVGSENAERGYLGNGATALTVASKRVITYQVQPGDTLEAIAAKFALDKSSVMGPNGIKDPDEALEVGRQLTIVPVSGAYHVVGKGETLEAIAAEYGVDVQKIIDYKLNGLEPPYKVEVGQRLVIPGGSIPRRDQAMTYTVREGDTLSYIAKKFGISTETLMWANNLVDENDVVAGKELVVLPVSGVKYVVKEGDTVESIAQRYAVDPKAITDYGPNGAQGGLIPVGQEIIIPGGKIFNRQGIVTHKVAPGDTLLGLANKYEISPETIVWANNIADANNLTVGQDLTILPTSGMSHVVQDGDTVEGIAQRYGVDPAAIIGFAANGLANGSALKVGGTIVVPGGTKPRPTPPAEPSPQVAALQAAQEAPTPTQESAAAPAPPPAPPEQPARQESQPEATPTPAPEAQEAPAEPQATAAPEPAPAPAPQEPAPAPQPPPEQSGGKGVATGHIIWPVTGPLTQYFGATNFEAWHDGIDIAPPYGTPIEAADGGVVTFAGWSPVGYGNLIIVDHGNGIQTWYGHQSAFAVAPGEKVAQGQVIGYVGSTGFSTGPHLHFKIVVNGVTVDPLGYLR